MTTQTQNEFVPANEPQFTLSATLVPDEQRINFWPQHFAFHSAVDNTGTSYFRLDGPPL